uniref:Uncharacterized protein n=1 Tax=Helianthus annuus TaxID=4232 RepID=A0A251SX08_HELAN
MFPTHEEPILRGSPFTRNMLFVPFGSHEEPFFVTLVLRWKGPPKITSSWACSCFKAQ